MSSFTFFSSVLLLPSVFSACPADNWVECASNGQTCTIMFRNGMIQTTIAYGDSEHDKWSFKDVSAPTEIEISCSTETFGDPDQGAGKVCCYNPDGTIIQDLTTGSAGDSSNWVQFASNGHSYTLSNNYNYLYWVRYGASGRYTYRLFNSYVYCDDEIFGDPYSGKSKYCDYFKIPYSTNYTATSGFVLCGYDGEGTGKCNFNASPTSVQPSLRLVGYGANNRYYYRHLLSTSEQINCDKEVFDDSDSGHQKDCYILYASYSNYFTNNIGYWYKANSCSGCNSIDVTLSQGVTSSSTEAATVQWSSSLTESVSNSLGFEDESETTQVSHSTSESISFQMSKTFTESVSESCHATCSINGASSLTLYQWVLNTNELIGVSKTPFKTYQCSYVCSNSNLAPQCPLGYCANSNCTTCNPWQ